MKRNEEILSKLDHWGRAFRAASRRAVVAAAGLTTLAVATPARAQPPALSTQLERVGVHPFVMRRIPVRALILRVDAQLGLEDLEAPLRATAVRFESTSQQGDQRLREIWFGGTRDASLRSEFNFRSQGRARLLRGAAAAVAVTGGIAMMLGGGVKGGRRSGRAGQAPLVDAGSQTGADLGVVMGSGVLLTSALMASLPLEGGVRRLRPMPIGGHRWGGAAVRWRF